MRNTEKCNKCKPPIDLGALLLWLAFLVVLSPLVVHIWQNWG